MLKNKLSYELTEEEKEIIRKAEYIKLKVFIYEFGKTIGAEILLQEDDTVLVDGVKMDSQQFEAYLNRITGGVSIDTYMRNILFDQLFDEEENEEEEDDDGQPCRYDA